MNFESFLGILHFSDGLFPVGSYAHSFGLESFVAEGQVRDANGVEAFLLSYLQGSVALCDVIAALASRTAALSGLALGAERCIDIDHALDAMKPASELRAASRQMGRQVLRIAGSLGEPFASHGLSTCLFEALGKEQTPGHHAMAFGVVAAALGCGEREMAGAYLYSTCAGLVAAALRLLPLGQLAGQRILWALSPPIRMLAEQSLGKDLADIWTFAPGIEIAAMRHSVLDTRLFRS